MRDTCATRCRNSAVEVPKGKRGGMFSRSTVPDLTPFFGRRFMFDQAALWLIDKRTGHNKEDEG